MISGTEHPQITNNINLHNRLTLSMSLSLSLFPTRQQMRSKSGIDMRGSCQTAASKEYCLSCCTMLPHFTSRPNLDSLLPAVIDSNGAVIHGMKRSAESLRSKQHRQTEWNRRNRQHWVRRLSLASKLLLNTLPQSPTPKGQKKCRREESTGSLPACLPAYLKTRGYYFVYFPSL